MTMAVPLPLFYQVADLYEEQYIQWVLMQRLVQLLDAQVPYFCKEDYDPFGLDRWERRAST